MGNSEVGHLNLGAGQIVRQDLTRIDDAVADGSFADNRVLRDACAAARERGRLHLLGLVSRGGVHSSMDHLRALIELAAREGVPDIVLHAFTDGRDTAPDSGAGYVAEVEGWLADGRRPGGERDRPLLRDGPRQPLGPHQAGDGRARARRGRGPPRGDRRGGGARRPTSAARPTSSSSRRWWGRGRGSSAGDAVIFFNFRPDRARQLTQALNTEMDLHYTTLTEYREDWDYPVAFPPERPATTLAEVLERARPRPAARGGDREVPARDLLLQRRGGGRPRGRGALPRRLTARRPDLRPQARDERARGRRRRSSSAGRRATTASGSSTSPTPTWSATRA